MLRGRRILATLVFALVAAAAPAGGVSASDQLDGPRYQACMRVGSDCGRRVEGGDIPYARFKDRTGRRPLVRVAVRDRDGRYCLRARRPARRSGVLFQPVLYKNAGRQVTTWRVNGKIVARWRWRVVPEPE